MLELTVLNKNQHFQTTIRDNSFRLGSANSDGINDVVIDDPLVSDYQCLIEVEREGNETTLKITNLGASMVLGNYSRIHHLVTSKHRMPCSLGAGDSFIQITASNPQSHFDHAIEHMQIIGTSDIHPENFNEADEVSPSPQTLSSWFEALGSIQRSTAGQNTFFKLAARNVYNPGGLDGCLILRRNVESWEVVAQHIPFPTDGIFYRRDLVEQAFHARLPLFHNNAKIDKTESPNDLHSAVICPVLDENRNVTAMVYGFRNCNRGNNRRGIRLLEAKFVNLIADSLSAGITRLNQEADRARQRVLLEQAFSPEVAQQLEANPDFLAGQEREVSVLFADLRGFCRISESVGASVTYQLLTDVMNRFTKIVHDHKGVIIDFYGDGMSAFWNAPVEQKNHTELACKTGNAILDAMKELNEVWAVEIGHRLRVGIGINTGNAQVGNSGSQNRLKYGPQGSVVNIASRLEKTTKQLGVNLVVSEDTARRVTDCYVPQRVCQAKLEGLNDPVGVFALVDPIEFSKSNKQYSAYAKGLELFESEKYLEALDIIMSLVDNESGSSIPMVEFLLKQINSRLKMNSQNAIPPELAHPGGVVCL